MSQDQKARLELARGSKGVWEGLEKVARSEKRVWILSHKNWAAKGGHLCSSQTDDPAWSPVHKTSSMFSPLLHTNSNWQNAAPP